MYHIYATWTWPSPRYIHKNVNTELLKLAVIGSIKSGGAAATRTAQYKKLGAAATRNGEYKKAGALSRREPGSIKSGGAAAARTGQ